MQWYSCARYKAPGPLVLVHLSRRPSVRLSVCPSVVNFSHFRLLLWNHWTEFNKTWQEARSQRSLPSLCFSGHSEKQDGRPGFWLAETFSTSPLKPLNGIQWNLTGSKISTSSTKFVFFGPIGKTWLAKTFSTSLLKPLIGIQRNLTGSKISTSFTKFMFFGPIEKQDGRPGLRLAETFSTSSLKPLNRIQRNLTGSKISTSSTKFVFSGPIEKQDGRPGLWLAETFSTETTEPNSTKLDRKQDLNVLYQVCVFRADRKNKMAALASDWLRHFRLLLWNRWTEFIETWQEARSQCPLQSLCFFRPISKQKCPPWPISQRGGTLYSGAQYVALWASCLTFALKFWNKLWNPAICTVFSGFLLFSCQLNIVQLRSLTIVSSIWL